MSRQRVHFIDQPIDDRSAAIQLQMAKRVESEFHNSPDKPQQLGEHLAAPLPGNKTASHPAR